MRIDLTETRWTRRIGQDDILLSDRYSPLCVLTSLRTSAFASLKRDNAENIRMAAGLRRLGRRSRTWDVFRNGNDRGGFAELAVSPFAEVSTGQQTRRKSEVRSPGSRNFGLGGCGRTSQ
jgi:hypothetical protein